MTDSCFGKKIEKKRETDQYAAALVHPSSVQHWTAAAVAILAQSEKYASDTWENVAMCQSSMEHSTLYFSILHAIRNVLFHQTLSGPF